MIHKYIIPKYIKITPQEKCITIKTAGIIESTLSDKLNGLMDKYTKFILTIIAVGILGLNYHLFKGEIISSAYAASGKVQKIAI